MGSRLPPAWVVVVPPLPELSVTGLMLQVTNKTLLYNLYPAT